MELFLKFMICCLCLNFIYCGSPSYKAAVVDVTKVDPTATEHQFAPTIADAARSNVDLLVLPTSKLVSTESSLEPSANGIDNFDELVESLSAAARRASVYVVAPLHESVTCQGKAERLTNSLVFDRTGAVISVHRKPVSNLSKCNTTSSRVGRFTTDFGVAFGVIMEDDLILINPQEIEGIKNFVVVDSSVPKRSFLFGKQFSSSWAFVNNVNVISAGGSVSGEPGPRTTDTLIVADLLKWGNKQTSLTSSPPSTFPSEDLNQYVIKPLNLEASMRVEGCSDSVCHGTFCCNFFLKTSVIDTNPPERSYGLVSYASAGLQTCSVVACAGMYKRTCLIGSENSTDIKFNVISINANFGTENTTQFPTILTTTPTVFNEENFRFTTENRDYKNVNIQAYNIDNLLTLGIVGRDYSSDLENAQPSVAESENLDFADYISSENVQEFFDYVWIRFRVLIFIVSVYILEMM